MEDTRTIKAGEGEGHEFRGNQFVRVSEQQVQKAHQKVYSLNSDNSGKQARTLLSVVGANDYKRFPDKVLEFQTSKHSSTRKNAPEQMVKVRGAKTEQRHLSDTHLHRYIDKAEKFGSEALRGAMVVKSSGKIYILDGNHRFATARLLGLKKISAKVIDLDAKPYKTNAREEIDNLLSAISADDSVLPEAVARQAAKTPTAWRDFNGASYDRSFVAAGIDDARELDYWNTAIGDILAGKNNPAQARIDFNSAFEDSELNRDWRQNLLVRTNLDQARGFGQQVRDLQPDAFFAAPAWELVRFEPRIHERGSDFYKEGTAGAISWPDRWQECLDDVGTGEERLAFIESGRMIALKDSEMWTALGVGWDDSIANGGAPPYAFNSGMDRVEVDRAECLELGLSVPDDEEQPPEVEDFNTDFQQPVGIDNTFLINAIRSILENGDLNGILDYDTKKGLFSFS